MLRLVLLLSLLGVSASAQQLSSAGRFCRTTGCTFSGTVNGTRFYTGSLTGVTFGASSTLGMGSENVGAGNIGFYSSGAAQWYVNGANGNWTSTLGRDTVSTSGQANFLNFKSAGANFASLPTCNAAAEGTLQNANDRDELYSCNGSSWAQVHTGRTMERVGAIGPTNGAASTIDSNLNAMLSGQFTPVTVRYLTGIYTAGTGTAGPIQVECTGLISGNRCLADIDCNGDNNGFDGGTYFTVPFFGYGATTKCTFAAGDLVYCLGRNTPVDGGTDCTADPTLARLVIEGTYP